MKKWRILVYLFIIISFLIVEYFLPSDKVSMIPSTIILCILSFTYYLCDGVKNRRREYILLALCFLSLLLTKWADLGAFVVFVLVVPLLYFFRFFLKRISKGKLHKRVIIVSLSALVIYLVLAFSNVFTSSHAIYLTGFTYFLHLLDDLFI